MIKAFVIVGIFLLVVALLITTVKVSRDPNMDTGTVELSQDAIDFHKDYETINDFVYVIPDGYNTTHFSLYGELKELEDG